MVGTYEHGAIDHAEFLLAQAAGCRGVKLGRARSCFFRSRSDGPCIVLGGCAAEINLGLRRVWPFFEFILVDRKRT